eukprot:9395433-Pyramimonas_sp.AAC.1
MRTPPLGLRWSSSWGHEALHSTGETHANTAAGAFGGASYGATKRSNTATGAFGRAPDWAAN